MLKAYIYRVRKVGEREEVKIKLFNPDGSPFEGGGGGGSAAFSAWSNEVQISNNSEDVIIPMDGQIDLDLGDLVDNAPAGAYSVKLHATWGAGSALSLGAAQISLMHIADDDSEVVLSSLVMSPEYPNMGDTDLSDIHATNEKIDLGLAPAHGRLELRAMQSTDQNFMTLTTRVIIAKL